RQHAGAHGFAIHMHRAGAALGKPAAETRTFEFEIVAQDVEKRGVGIDIDSARLSVHREVKSGHIALPGRAIFSAAAGSATVGQACHWLGRSAMERFQEDGTICRSRNDAPTRARGAGRDSPTNFTKSKKASA